MTDPFKAWWQINGFTRVRGTDRFWRKVAVTNDPTSCWLWKNGVSGEGYGQAHWQGRTMKAHRVACLLANGPIPAGVIIMHRCDNPLCCRPSHLMKGSPRDNSRDMVARGRYRHHVLTHDQVRAIRAATGLSLSMLASEYGVNYKAIWKIRHGVSYRQVEA